jgi:hypothetical protein
MLSAMTKPLFLASLLLAAALSGTIGYQLGRQRAIDAAPERPGQSDATARQGGSGGSRTGAGPAAPADEDLGRQVARASADPVYLQQLLARYRAESEPDHKGAVLAILQGVANQDVQRFALELAASPDPSTRRDGLALLSAYSVEEAPVRELLIRQMGQEQDPALLKTLVELLAPAPLASEDIAPMLGQLERLRQHADPGVRAAAVLQSAQWDKSAGVEDILQRALLDSEPQVREAAIAGVTSSATRSDRIKDALLEIANNPHSGREERAASVFALQNFELDRAEYAIYRNAAEATSDDDGH